MLYNYHNKAYHVIMDVLNPRGRAAKPDMEQDITAFLSNIQKFSLHDGPGIRTAVFFKGCPLACLWCSNPETREAAGSVLRDSAKCVRCPRCAEACPAGAIREDLSVNKRACTACGNCARECPQKALSLNGRRYSP